MAHCGALDADGSLRCLILSRLRRRRRRALALSICSGSILQLRLRLKSLLSMNGISRRKASCLLTSIASIGMTGARSSSGGSGSSRVLLVLPRCHGRALKLHVTTKLTVLAMLWNLREGLLRHGLSDLLRRRLKWCSVVRLLLRSLGIHDDEDAWS